MPVPYFYITDPENAAPVQVGNHVRSFDFEAYDDIYVEGTVLEITDPKTHAEWKDCMRYRILVDTEVLSGLRLDAKYKGREVFPPVNGTRVAGMGGRMINGVRAIEEIKPAGKLYRVKFNRTTSTTDTNWITVAAESPEAAQKRVEATFGALDIADLEKYDVLTEDELATEALDKTELQSSEFDGLSDDPDSVVEVEA